MQRLAMLSLHTSPLVQPGVGDGGGMNVYVRELVASLAQAGIETSVYVRRWSEELPEEVLVEPGFRVVHVEAGRSDLAKEQLPAIVASFTEGVRADMAVHPVDALHANYWLSGVAGHRLKHELGLPLVSTFHTLARVKAMTGDTEPERRIHAEAKVIECSDAILASSAVEADQLVELYGADRERIEMVPPGVDRAFFSPGDQRGARLAVGRATESELCGPVLLFVGRIQPLKGLDVAVQALPWIPDATLVVVGGASGRDGVRHLAEVRATARRLGVERRVRWIDPQPHHLLSTWYRAADLVVVPSRSESFGLVALEASACGIPVVAADVGGLRSLIEDGRNGFLVDGRDPHVWAATVNKVLDDPSLSSRLSDGAVVRSREFTWSVTAARLRRVYADLSARALVPCPPAA